MIVLPYPVHEGERPHRSPPIAGWIELKAVSAAINDKEVGALLGGFRDLGEISLIVAARTTCWWGRIWDLLCDNCG